MMKKTLACLTASLLLALGACSSKPEKYDSLHKGPQQKAWHNIGVTPSGNVMNEIDQRSIRRQGTRVVFRDRKTIFNMQKESFLNTPPHKQSLNTWEIDCESQTYRLIDTVLYDSNLRLISSAQYKTGETRHLPIQKDSAAFYQMKFVCDQ